MEKETKWEKIKYFCRNLWDEIGFILFVILAVIVVLSMNVSIITLIALYVPYPACCCVFGIIIPILLLGDFLIYMIFSC